MLDLTKDEKRVIIFFVFIWMTGTALIRVSRLYPSLWNMVNVMEGHRLYDMIDPNDASYDELLKIPSIGPVIARKIVTYRREKGPFKDPDDLRCVSGISGSTLKIIKQYIRIQ